MMAKTDGSGARPKPQKKLGVSAVEAARQLGVTRQALYAWSKQGWLVRFPDRSVDIEATRARVDACRDPLKGGKHDRDIGPAPSYSPPDAGDDSPIDEEDYKAARTRRERAAADKAEIEAARMRGDLIPRADAEAAYVGVIVAAKAAIVAVPVRVAPLIAGMTDVRAIRDVVRREIETALKGLSDEPPAV